MGSEMCIRDSFNPIIELVSILGVHTYFRHLVLSVCVNNYPTLSLDKSFVKSYIALGIQESRTNYSILGCIVKRTILTCSPF